MKKLDAVVLGMAAIAVAIATGDISQSNAQSTRYPTRTSPVDPTGGARIHQGLYWLDNDSILYRSDPPKSNAKPVGTAYLNVWNIRQNTVKQIGEERPSYLGFCYANGFLRYATRREFKDVIFKEGPLDNLVERRVHEDQVGDDAARKRGEIPSRFTCSNPTLAEVGPCGKWLVPLRNGDGFLDLTGGSCADDVQRRLKEVAALPTAEIGIARRRLEDELHSRPAMYLPTARGPPIELPVKSGELYAFGPGSIAYSEWSGEYVFPTDDTMPRSAGTYWPKGLPHPIYLLHPNGAIRRVDMPYTDWNKGLISAAVLTRLGVVVVSHSTGRNGEIGHAGVYLIAQGKLERVLRGYVVQIAVSPNGCNVAASVADLKVGSGRLNAIDVCNGRQ